MAKENSDFEFHMKLLSNPSLLNLPNRNPSWDSSIGCSSESQPRLINQTITYYNVPLVSWGYGNILKNSKIPHIFPASQFVDRGPSTLQSYNFTLNTMICNLSSSSKKFNLLANLLILHTRECISTNDSKIATYKMSLVNVNSILQEGGIFRCYNLHHSRGLILS